MAPPGHTEKKKQSAIETLIQNYMNDDMIKDVGLFDVKRLNKFLNDYRNDEDNVSLVRKDALLNHLIGLHVLSHQFLKQNVWDSPLISKG